MLGQIHKILTAFSRSRNISFMMLIITHEMNFVNRSPVAMLMLLVELSVSIRGHSASPMQCGEAERRRAALQPSNFHYPRGLSLDFRMLCCFIRCWSRLCFSRNSLCRRLHRSLGLILGFTRHVFAYEMNGLGTDVDWLADLHKCNDPSLLCVSTSRLIPASSPMLYNM
jgi:hypothetical protein